MELRRYTKKPVLIIKRITHIGLFLFYQLNIIYSKLVTIGKLELISKVIIYKAIGVV